MINVELSELARRTTVRGPKFEVSGTPNPASRNSYPVSRIVTSPSQCPGSTSKSERLSRSTAPNEEHLTAINIMFIVYPVIQTFADSETERFYTAGKSRRMPPEIRKRAAMRLLQLNAATQIEDLRLPPSNRLEQLHGDRAGQWSMRINDQWRVCFRFKNGDASEVEIVDYH